MKKAIDVYANPDAFGVVARAAVTAAEHSTRSL